MEPSGREEWLRMKIGGMSCSFCTNTIQTAYERIDGVHEIVVSLAHEEGLVKYDPARVMPTSSNRRCETSAAPPVAGDSAIAEHVKVAARAHQTMIWTRQRSVNTLRSMLREFYPAALVAFDELAGRDALAFLAAAPDPDTGRRLTPARITTLLRRAGR